MLNEENISQETSLLNIDPRLIRIDRDSLRGSQQSVSREKDASQPGDRRTSETAAVVSASLDPSSSG
jgi:propanediol utilization protein